MFFSRAAAARLRYGALCALALAFSLSSPVASASTLPTISGAPPTRVVAAHYYSFQPNVGNPSGAGLTFSISNKPSWASLSSTGRLYGTPIPPGNVGTFGGIVICMSTGTYRKCLPAFAVKVLPLPDVPPVISGTPATIVKVGSAYSFQPTAHDPDGLRIDFGIWDKPSWLNFDSTTGRLYGTPTAANVGTYSNIVISVYDGYYNSHIPAFSITVPAPPPQLPAGDVTITWTPPTENTDGSTLTDLTGYRIYYGTSRSALTKVVNITNPGLASYVISNLTAATWYFSVTSLNSNGVESPRSAIVSYVIQ